MRDEIMVDTRIDTEWIESLSVGDEVAYGDYRWMSGFTYSEVKKISPSAKIITTESGVRFTKHGYRVGDQERNSGLTVRRTLVRLIHPDKARQIEAESKASHAAFKKSSELKQDLVRSINQLSIDQLEKMKAFVETLKATE